MSWMANAIVTDGDTDALEGILAGNNELYYPPLIPESMIEQQTFALEMVTSAFECGVVEGTYNVSISGHSNPDQENDRKSLAVTFSPTVLATELEGYTE